MIISVFLKKDASSDTEPREQKTLGGEKTMRRLAIQTDVTP